MPNSQRSKFVRKVTLRTKPIDPGVGSQSHLKEEKKRKEFDARLGNMKLRRGGGQEIWVNAKFSFPFLPIYTCTRTGRILLFYTRSHNK